MGEKRRVHSLAMAAALGLAVQGTGEEKKQVVRKAPRDHPRLRFEIEKLPAAVVHQVEAEDRHVYTISGLMTDRMAEGIERRRKERDEGIKSFEKSISRQIHGCTEAAIDMDAGTCTIRVPRELKGWEIAYMMDCMAFSGGGGPYWVELEARELAKSKEFAEDCYTLLDDAEELPDSMAWFQVPRCDSFSMPLMVGPGLQGRFLVTPVTESCMCHSRYAIRVLDAEDRVLWLDEKSFKGALRVALSDVDGDGVHEICIHRDDHGVGTKYLIRENWDKPDEPESSPDPFAE